MQYIVHRDGYNLEAYLEYLSQMAEHMPRNAMEFATAPWHYDISDHRCPHDSWVESLSIQEIARGVDSSDRVLIIDVELLGAYHDGKINIRYIDVESYEISLPTVRRAQARIGHGDWMIDEIVLLSNEIVRHEVVFEKGGVWKVDCRDIVCKWVPL